LWSSAAPIFMELPLWSASYPRGPLAAMCNENYKKSFNKAHLS